MVRCADGASSLDAVNDLDLYEMPKFEGKLNKHGSALEKKEKKMNLDGP